VGCGGADRGAFRFAADACTAGGLGGWGIGFSAAGDEIKSNCGPQLRDVSSASPCERKADGTGTDDVAISKAISP